VALKPEEKKGLRSAPERKEGGREEEENRPRIAANGWLRRLKHTRLAVANTLSDSAGTVKVPQVRGQIPACFMDYGVKKLLNGFIVTVWS
jgi:hypothetical protein